MGGGSIILPGSRPDAAAKARREQLRADRRALKRVHCGPDDYICCQCTKGLSPGEVKTYSERCASCRKKKAAGLRTGLEPAPSKNPAKRRIARKTFMAQVAKENEARRNRRKFWASTPRRGQP